MQEDIYITASSVIDRRRVFKNEMTIFENKDTGVGEFLIAAYRHLGINYPKFYKMDNLARLGWLASEVLLKNSFNAAGYSAEEVGIVLMNASSSLDADLRYFESTKEIPSPALFVYTLPNIVIGEICIKHKFKGESAFFIFEVFDAGFLEKYVSNLINNNILQACICGWVELIGENYKSVLFLVEKNSTGNLDENKWPGKMLFTKENLDKIYNEQHG